MLWLESHADLGGHPKTKRLKNALKTSIPATVGHLTLLWHWALKYAQDGDLSGFTDEEIADAAMWEGDPYEFVQALVTTGWVDDTVQGLVLHEWEQYGGKSIQAREHNAERQRRHRQSKAPVQERRAPAPEPDPAPDLPDEPVEQPLPIIYKLELDPEPELEPADYDPVDPVTVTRAIAAPLRNGYVTVMSPLRNGYVTPYITEHNITEHNRTGPDITKHNTTGERERRDLTPRARAPAREGGDEKQDDDADTSGSDPETAWWQRTVAQRAEREGLDATVLLGAVDVATETEQWQARDSPGVWRNWMLRALGFAVRDLHAANQKEQDHVRTEQRAGASARNAVGVRADRAGAGSGAGAPDRQNGQAAAAPPGPRGAAAILAALSDPHSSVSQALEGGAAERRVRPLQRDGPDHSE